jgi:hypothetical protein
MRLRRTLTALALLSTIGVAGCARITHVPTASFAKPKGVPYYLGSYYLLTYPDGRGGLASQYFFLRDPNKKMFAKSRAWLANISSLLKFEGGVLTNSESTADSTALPAALIEAAETLMKTLAAANVVATGVQGPSIYKVRFTSATQVTFIGDRSKYTVSVGGWSES